MKWKHFKDPIPDLDIGVESRDKELVKHSIQLFYGYKCLNEVKETLQYFLDLKNEKKESTIESILLQKIVAPLVIYEGPEMSAKKSGKNSRKKFLVWKMKRIQMNALLRNSSR